MAVTEDGDESWSVGELADASGITVRTLHHYDRLGLLVPSQRTIGRHRRYSDDDVAALYRIVALRRLGFSLTEIGEAVTAAHPLTDLLRHQLDETAAAIDARQELLTQLKRCLAVAERAEGLGPDELLELIAETVRAQPEPVDFSGYRIVETTAGAVLCSIFEGVTPSHGAVRRLLCQLSDDNLRLAATADDGSMTVGGGLVHTVVFEDDYVNRVMRSSAAVWESENWSHAVGVDDLARYRSCKWDAVREPLPQSFDKSRFEAYAEVVFSTTFAYIADAPAAELGRDIPGPGRSALGWSMKVSELLAQVAAHTFAHAAEIRTLAAVLRPPV